MFDVVVGNDQNKETIRCESDSCTIGKTRENLVQLRGWRIARVHALLQQTEEGVFLHDRSGGIGTLVNGKKQTTYGPLSSSDVIHIGGYDFRVILPDNDVLSRKEDLPLPTSMEQLHQHPSVSITQKVAASEGVQSIKKHVYIWRNRIHKEIVKVMDLRRTDIGAMDEGQLRENVRALVDEVVDGMAEQIPGDISREQIKKDVLNEAIGLGPLEDLLEDPKITEIMVNRFDDIYIEQAGKLMKTGVTFSSDDAVMSAIERIVSPLGRRIDESSPMVDARLKDGSRVNAIIPPLALKGPCVTIRKFSKQRLTDKDLLNFGTVNEEMVSFLRTAVENRCNIIISGGTGSGKTTLLNILSNFIPHRERVVTVEDAAELQLNQPHLVSLEARPANLEGRGAVTIRDLVKNCLRMRPDRIVVGECRSGEALDMLQAMNTGHDGSLTTVHANSPRDSLSRLEVMVMMSGMDLPVQAIREQVVSAVDIIVQQNRFSDGSRRVTQITEVTGIEGDTVTMSDIFQYKQRGFDAEGNIVGDFLATGQVPNFYQTLRERGVQVDMSIFEVDS